jgi:hypothetical protein
MLTNRTDCTWTIQVRETGTDRVVSTSTVRPHATLGTFLLPIEKGNSRFKRYTDVVLTDDGVYFDDALVGTRRNGVTIVRFLDSPMRAEFKVVR